MVDQAYFGSEVAKTIGIGSSTLRKYCIALEEQGYQFERGINNSRVFYQKDILMIQRILATMQKKNITLEQSINLAVSIVSEDERTPAVLSQGTTNSEGEAILERLDRLEDFNQKLMERLDQQQTYIQESMERRDRQLMETLRGIQETQLLLAATKEKKWWQFWK
ncbi:DUF3967 domain-containing protein [Gottfriedia luciferensis]|uniref:DUF3967 domain-containing protein n=1 Tax=Gottfriedia luciferensis TaxID=178774 RepID=UPI001F233BA2|nr:DUF3967 domain-containing protein [Gottfriedia luciferensis]